MSTKVLLPLILLALALALVPFAQTSDGATTQEPLPQETYPDADIIITADAKGFTLITFKAYGEYQVTKEHPSEWFTKTITSSDVSYLRNMSEASEDMEIVFDGATVRKLTLFNLDTKASLNSAIDVHFTMVSGSISTLSLYTASSQVKQYLPSSYDAMPSAIHSATMDLISGTIDVLNPTDLMLSITKYDVCLENGMVVNRLYTTGENGRYSNVSVTVNGATIGYMTNLASKIGNLEYDIRFGTIDYLSLGSNTEHMSARKLADMPTCQVTGDVYVYIGPSTVLGKCILGAGILNIPQILSTGEYVENPIVHMISIDARGFTVSSDSAFLTERRTSAYSLYNYEVGKNPHTYSLMTSFYNNGESMQVYSETGVWSSISNNVLTTGSVLSINCNFVVQQDGEFILEEGATLYNSDNLVVSGILDIEGLMVNNSVIQCRSGSTVLGTYTGIGVMADYVHYSSPAASLNVMSQSEAAVIDLDQMYPVESISAYLSDDRRSVTITIEGSQRIYGDQFTIALVEKEPPETFSASYRLDIKGIDKDVLGICTVEVTLPTDPEVCTAVYVFDPTVMEYVALANSEYESEISFTAGTYNTFYLYNYTTDRPELPDPIINTEMKAIDYYLIAAIIAVLAVTTYLLVTMKRD